MHFKESSFTRDPRKLTFLERHDRQARDIRASDLRSRSFETFHSNGNVVPFAFDKAIFGDRRVPHRVPIGPAKVLVPPKAAKRERRKILIATIIVSAAVHAAAIASTMSGDTGEQFGMLTSKTDTFSLATTQSIVLNGSPPTTSIWRLPLLQPPRPEVCNRQNRLRELPRLRRRLLPINRRRSRSRSPM